MTVSCLSAISVAKHGFVPPAAGGALQILHPKAVAGEQFEDVPGELPCRGGRWAAALASAQQPNTAPKSQSIATQLSATASTTPS